MPPRSLVLFLLVGLLTGCAGNSTLVEDRTGMERIPLSRDTAEPLGGTYAYVGVPQLCNTDCDRGFFEALHRMLPTEEEAPDFGPDAILTLSVEEAQFVRAVVTVDGEAVYEEVLRGEVNKEGDFAVKARVWLNAPLGPILWAYRSERAWLAIREDGSLWVGQYGHGVLFCIGLPAFGGGVVGSYVFERVEGSP